MLRAVKHQSSIHLKLILFIECSFVGSLTRRCGLAGLEQAPLASGVVNSVHAVHLLHDAEQAKITDIRLDKLLAQLEADEQAGAAPS